MGLSKALNLYNFSVRSKIKVKTQLKTQINLNKSMKTIYKSCFLLLLLPLVFWLRIL
jgi:hypothetical protein